MFEELIARVASAFETACIPYMIIGGQAVLLYGTPRMTRDIDITLGVGTDGLEEVVGAVATAGLKILPENYQSFVERTWVLPTQDELSGLRVNLIFSITPYEREAIERAGTVSLRGTSVRFASLEDVIIHKVFAGRPRDFEDVRSIILKNPHFDEQYIVDWLKQFDQSVEGGAFLNKFREVMNPQWAIGAPRPKAVAFGED